MICAVPTFPRFGQSFSTAALLLKKKLTGAHPVHILAGRIQVGVEEYKDSGDGA
jgi:hypothetical protein